MNAWSVILLSAAVCVAILGVSQRIHWSSSSISNGLGNIFSSLETTNLCLSDISKSLRARTLSEKTVLALQDWGSRDFLNFKGDQDGEASQAYRNGLADGATLTSQFVIGRMKEEND